MPCYTIPSWIDSEALSAIGLKYKREHGEFPGHAEYIRLIAEYNRTHGPDLSQPAAILCGDFGPPCIDCGNVSDALCDFPVGRGKTCDRAICTACSPDIQPNLNYCAPHRAEWEKFRSEALPDVMFTAFGPRKPPPKRRKPPRIV